MSHHDREKWNQKYAGRQPQRAFPDSWLAQALRRAETSSFTPVMKRALDVACGLGHNSLWLAQQGWSVDAVDISAQGLALAEQSATAAQIDRVQWIEADLDDWQPEPCAYDLLMVFRFLDRKSLPRIVNAALRPGGLLIIETFARAHCERPDNQLHNVEFTLARGELATLFPFCRVVEEREDALADRTVQRYLGVRRN